MKLQNVNKPKLLSLKEETVSRYNAFMAKNLKLDMSRGRPGADQLDICEGLLTALSSNAECVTGGVDCRNYGGLDGIPAMKKIFADILAVAPENVVIGGNSSLTMMYDTIARAMTHSQLKGGKPWSACSKIKFLCPSPGYDRHFCITKHFGIEMLTVPMKSDGPDMDVVRELVKDADVKGIWCVPKYSNPQGITYSDSVVTAFASLKPAADDFKIIWDNAYCVHDIADESDVLLDIFGECKKYGSEDMIFEFASTSKISYPGAGVACLAASKANIDHIKKHLFVQTIGPDKLNQLRHVIYYKDADGVYAHMQKHKAILAPKFGMVLDTLKKELDGLDIAEWNSPNGGYFISLDVVDGYASRVLELCASAGVAMTPAGSTYPYMKDPFDRNIRIAPTAPTVSDLAAAAELFCICVKLAIIETL